MKFDESENSVSCMPSSPYKPLVEHRGGWTVSRAPIRMQVFQECNCLESRPRFEANIMTAV